MGHSSLAPFASVFRLLLAASAAIAGCASPHEGPLDPAPLAVQAPFTQVAASPSLQWTGIAVSREGRIFVSFPRWPGPHLVSVAQLKGDVLRPYPDAAWNSWKPGVPSTADAFVCVQALHIDGLNRLWVLDPANPGFHGVVRDRSGGGGGPKLVQIDPATDRVVRVIRFSQLIAPDGSYLNDVRVDAAANRAYITDSGLGALVVVDLGSGEARRVLAHHPSTRAENTDAEIDGKTLRFADGSTPKVNSDGIALDARRGWLYYQPLTGRTLYRLPTSVLNDFATTTEQVEGAVETLGPSVMTDGMEIDAAGNLYFTAIEKDAIVVRKPNGDFGVLVRDKQLAWPDSFAFGPNGDLFVVCSQIHRSPLIVGETAGAPVTPYLILKIPAASLPQ